MQGYLLLYFHIFYLHLKKFHNFLILKWFNSLLKFFEFYIYLSINWTKHKHKFKWENKTFFNKWDIFCFFQKLPVWKNAKLTLGNVNSKIEFTEYLQDTQIFFSIGLYIFCTDIFKDNKSYMFLGYWEYCGH